MTFKERVAARKATFWAEVDALRELPAENFDMLNWLRYRDKKGELIDSFGFYCSDLHQKEKVGEAICGTVQCFAGNIAMRHYKQEVDGFSTIPNFASRFLGIPGDFRGRLFIVSEWLEPHLRDDYQKAQDPALKKRIALKYFEWFGVYILPFLAFPEDLGF